MVLDPLEQRNVFAQRIKELRQKKGWQQIEVAEKLGLPRSNTYANWEAATRMPKRQSMVLRLAELFAVSVDYLMGRTDNPEPAENLDDIFLRELEITDVAELLKKYNFTVDHKPITQRQARLALNMIRTFVESEREEGIAK